MAKAAAEPRIVRALASFVGAVGGADIDIRAGDLFAGDDPVVKKWPDSFGPVVVRVSAPGPRIEQATAGPGEKRGA